ncbi:MAG: BatD family protein [Alistipes putredinis]|nr:MAG: BatD family protein [Alistipes putredinis]
MGTDIREVRRKLSTQPVKITVKSLPAGAPAGFSGAVGQFAMEADMPASSISANSSAAYTIKISGRGNLPLIQSPKIKFPTSFEQYNVKTTESLKSSATGISGYRQFEYPFIARAEGQYTVPEVEFSYFNPQSAQYVTLLSKQFRVDVTPDSSAVGNVATGIVSGLSKEDIKILGQDIRFIRLGQPAFTQKGRFFMWSGGYFAILAAMLAAAAAGYVLLERYLKKTCATIHSRAARGANRMALVRLRQAETYMKRDDERGFYDEMLKAMWGYMSDKLNIPVSLLSKENIREQLLRRDISPQVSERFISLIALCEQAQYSPQASLQMHEVYKEGVELISKFESVIKKDKNRGGFFWKMKYLSILLFPACVRSCRRQ